MQTGKLMKNTKLVKAENFYGYFEDSQQIEIKYSVANFDNKLQAYKEEYESFLCRDYFTEILLARQFPDEMENVYGLYAYTPWKKRSILTIEIPENLGEKGIQKFYDAIGILIDFETKHFKITSDFSESNIKRNFLVRPHPFWTTNPVLMSFFTVWFRMIHFIDTKDTLNSDIIFKKFLRRFNYNEDFKCTAEHLIYKQLYNEELENITLLDILESFTKISNKKLSNISSKLEEYINDCPCWTSIHNNSGFYSFLKTLNWYRRDKEDFEYRNDWSLYIIHKDLVEKVDNEL